ncbi:hypothetical protein N0V82_003571 [Gnomoniopsis sp. IMI 355080]|nr:hypothetical protein N0V82_003571 [Gnomoniopsis sp. IMI 355080]
MKYFITLLSATAVHSFPFVANVPGVDTRLFRPRQQPGGSGQAGGAATCPFNANHVPAPGITTEFPYNHAANGLPGLGVGGYQVPADGDTAHQFQAPGADDIRGPCPGLNAAANHNFLARDGITTFNELVDAQQNIYNVGYDLAVLLALLGLTLTDGDIVTQKLSIGCDATTRTSISPLLTGSEPGLDGHNKFEGDASLTRNDYFLDNGDDFTFNATLFKMMTDSTGGIYDRAGMSKYRLERWQQSQQQNSEFFFGPLTVLLYGASSFLYELMPSGPDYIPDEATISSFFGATKQSDGTYTFSAEQIPANWTNRVTPYSTTDVTAEILAQYLANPVLFGGNTGNGGFDTVDFKGFIQNGTLLATPNGAVIACLLYQLLTFPVSSNLNSVITPTVETLTYILTKIQPTLENLGCSIPLT